MSRLPFKTATDEQGKKGKKKKGKGKKDERKGKEGKKDERKFGKLENITKQEELHAIMAPFLPATPSSCPASAATSPAPLLSPPPPPADTETLPAFLEQGEVEVARSPGPTPPYPGYQPAATWAGPDLNTYTFTEAEAGSVAECEELALEQYSVTLELAPAATWAGPDLNTAEEFELSFLAPVHG